MALQMVLCRFCSTSLDGTHTCALFSKDALAKSLPERFSNLVQLPVSESDGLSPYSCRKCVGRLNSVLVFTKEMRYLAQSSYNEAGCLPSSSSTGSPTARVNSRKRTKDTSGQGTSPHTTQARPAAKRVLGTLGRRLTYSTLSNSYIAHKLYMTL